MSEVVDPKGPVLVRSSRSGTRREGDATTSCSVVFSFEGDKKKHPHTMDATTTTGVANDFVSRDCSSSLLLVAREEVTRNKVLPSFGYARRLPKTHKHKHSTQSKDDDNNNEHNKQGK